MTVSVIQSASAQNTGGVPVTLGAAPTAGRTLVACCGTDTDSGPTFSFSQGSWTQVGITVYSGNGTNWPNRIFICTATGGMSASTTVTKSFGTGSVKACIAELSTLVAYSGFSVSANNTSSCTGSINPTAGRYGILISGTFSRATNILAPAGSMTELQEVGTNHYAMNAQALSPADGVADTVGSTNAAANSSMIAVFLQEILPTRSTFVIQ